MQLEQRFAATDILGFAVNGSPLHPFADQQRQRTPGQRRVGSQGLCDSDDHPHTEFAATQLHVTYIASFTHSVKCVPQPEPSGRLSRCRWFSMVSGRG